MLDSLAQLYPYYEINYRKWLPLQPAAPILDYGCGAGGFLKYAEALGYNHLVGFDIDTRYATFARSHLRAHIEQSNDGLSFLRARRNEFDFVMSRQVAYYFPRAALQEWFNALAGTLRAGGTLVIEVVNGAGIAGSWPYVNDPFMQTVFSESLLAALIERTGLKLLELRDERIPPGGFKRALWVAGRKAWARALRTIYTIERGVDDRNPRLFGKNLVAVAHKA